MDNKLLGLKIKQLRSEHSLKIGKKFYQKDLADALGISRGYIGDIESGRTKPNDELLNKIANIFNVSVDYLLKEDNDIKLMKPNDAEIIDSNSNEIILNKRDMKDIEKTVEATISELEKQESLMLSGNPVDEADWDLIKSAIRNGIEYAKKMNKEKYTPKKYRK